MPLPGGGGGGGGGGPLPAGGQLLHEGVLEGLAHHHVHVDQGQLVDPLVQLQGRHLVIR